MTQIDNEQLNKQVKNISLAYLIRCGGDSKQSLLRWK